MNEDELNDLLAPLRAVEPDEAIRRANRHAALNALRPTPWWQRSVTVPLPVALATAAALLLVVGQATFVSVTIDSPRAFEPTAAPPRDEPSNLEDSSDFRLVESRRYVPGLGVVYRNVSFEPNKEL